MTLDEFVNNNKGKKLDYDGAFGAQCMDLYRIYVRDVLSYPQSPPVVGAKDVWDTYLKDHYTRLENTPEAVVQKGDIVIWGSSYGPFGHIAVALSGDVDNFTAFSQNDPIGSPCVVNNYNYASVLGWLRPNTLQQEDTMEKIDLRGLQTELETYGVIELDTLKSKLIAKDRAIKSLEGSVASLGERIAGLEKENKKLLAELEVAKQAIQEAEENRVRLEKKIEQLEAGLNEPALKSRVARLLYELAKRLG